MPKLIITTRDGADHEVDGKAGWSVMENIRDNGIDEVLALCGGCCSCATCHVHVDPDWFEKTGGPGEDENDLLDTSDHRTQFSRLSCQIQFSDALDGLRVTVAPED